MATVDWSCVSKENANFSRLVKLLIDGGTRVLREVFDSVHPPKVLKTRLLDPANHSILKHLKSKNKLYKEQWDKLYPPGGSTVTSGSFDITLLCLLLRNICHLKTPTGGWNNPPAPTSTNTEDDVVRFKFFRNVLYGHINEAAISDIDFANHWKDIESVMVRLGGTQYQAEIDGLKIVPMNPEDEEYFAQCLKEWVKNEDRIMKALDDLAEKVHEQAEKTQQELKKVQVMLSTPPKEKHLDIELCSEYLKSSTKRQTEFQPKFMAIHSVSRARTDEIFTNLTIQRGRKPLKEYENARRLDQLTEYSKPTGTPIKTSKEIFLGPEKNKTNPKSILVVGKPGIGKSLFCQKLVRDWANDALFYNDPNGFDFVYLLTFRQLNLLGNKELHLREVLNRSSLLDQHSNIDEPLFEYITEHSEKVLLILDGYDEYAHRENICTNLEEEYENNPRIPMPVPALFSKLTKKKMFSDATIMVTSRPREAEDELGGIDFDAVVEIEGFSPKQVEEFIGKYFQSKSEKVLNAAREHIMKSENLLSVGHIPMLCFLICWCLEWEIESKIKKDRSVTITIDDLPITITDLYSSVVRIFETKHHSKSDYRKTEFPGKFKVPLVVKETIDKLSKLAAETILEKKFIFEESDLEKFDITSEDAEILKASGLLTCSPGIRDTDAFSMPLEFCFVHLTFHEYLAALEFVKNKEILVDTKDTKLIISPMVFQFMAGLLSKERNEHLMEQLMEIVSHKYDDLLPAKCLYEYRDKEFGARIVKKYHRCFCRGGNLQFGMPYDLSEVDRVAVSFFLNLVCECCKETKEQILPNLKRCRSTGNITDIEEDYHLQGQLLILHRILPQRSHTSKP